MISTISDALYIVEFLMGLRETFRGDPQEKALQEIAESVRSIDKKLLTKQEVYEIASQYSLPEPISIKLFGEHLSHEHANQLLTILKSKPEKQGHNTGIDLSAIQFNESHFMFSSYGTPGYLYQINDGKSVVVYHAGGEDRDRIFSVRAGIGYYYRAILRGPASFLGFPVSDEHSTGGLGRSGAKSMFEGGSIEYIPEHNRLHIYRASLTGSRLVATHNF